MAVRFWQVAMMIGITSSVVFSGPLTDGLRLMGALGQSISLPNQLSIHRNDGKQYVIDAVYRNRSFENYPYWTARLEWWQAGDSWEFEAIHHKIYLANPPAGIVDFSISDGYNMFFLNRGHYVKDWDVVGRLGAGVTFSHPDVTFSDRPRYYIHGWSGHRISGWGVQMAIEKRFDVSASHYLSTELKVTAAYARSGISDDYQHDYAVAPDVAVHLVVGFGSHPVTDTSLGSIMGYLAPLALPVSTYVFPNN